MGGCVVDPRVRHVTLEPSFATRTTMIETGSLKRKYSDEENSEYTPTATILLAIPMLVSYPPDHPLHIPGLRVSLRALRRCTGLTDHNDNVKRVKGDGWVAHGEAMTPELEIRAWVALVEVGMMVVATRSSRWGEDDQSAWDWTTGVEQDIDTALRQGLGLATSLPSLRSFKEPLTLLSARAATPKRAVKILSTMLSSSATEPTKYTYEAYLALADLHLRPAGKSTSGQGRLNPNLGAGLHVLEQMRARAEQAGDVAAAQLAMVAMLRAKVVHGTDSGVSETMVELEASLNRAEWVLGIPCPPQPETTPTDKYSLQPPNTSPSRAPTQNPQTPELSSTPHKSSEEEPDDAPILAHVYHLQAHVLFLGVALYTHLGDAHSAAQRLGMLHNILDNGCLDFPDEECFCGRGPRPGQSQNKDMPTVDLLGVTSETDLNCPCASSFLLPIPLASNDSLLIKSTHPRVIFELAFLVSSIARRDVVGRKPRRLIFSTEGLRAGAETGIEVAFPVWATLEDVRETELRLAEIRADLMCELVAAAIRASPTGSFIHTSSSAGLIGLKMGINARDKYITSASKSPSTPPPDTGTVKPDQKLLAACTYSLAPLAHILTSPTLPIVRAKQELKIALDLSSKAQDNYLRALGVAMSAAKYMHTAESHAGVMLGTVKALAAGMGALENKKGADESPSKDARDDGKSRDAVKKNFGNAVLGLWVGLRLYELHKRAGDAEQAKKQDLKNRRLIKAVGGIETATKDKIPS
ncbi:hypothetical protein RSOLAG1IB_10549 [Rhizoctonia solani AG-1 IB]|uniref:Uncharacterized protein n=1 Tax=Thanatephorus cucumeris (strain AG1-IB / isolate 7/3/14) TaxID=1108050 RepID=A0A0B7FY43_THACB|nr:hypothetical protein RSOLAG1IB_10549 [Rhizoctonia solani AG-1 IB]